MTDIESVLHSEATWVENAVSLREFANLYALPNVVKVAKGQYRNIGSQSLCNELYLHSIQKCNKILAEGIKIRNKDSRKNGKRAMTSNGQHFAIPLSYQGWFELLSEDGKPIRPITCIHDLIVLFPHKILIRENIKAYISKDMKTIDKHRSVLSGEILTLVDEVLLPQATTKGLIQKKFLHCLDRKGEGIYFTLDQKGVFSPLAGQGNISGVHNVKPLLEKFRLPVTVRLVHGVIPVKLEKNQFTGVFRLLGIFSDEIAFVFPLGSDTKMVAISTREPLKVIPAHNITDLKEFDEYAYYTNKTERMISSYLNSIHVMVCPPDFAAVKSNNRYQSSFPESSSNLKNNVKTEEDILFEEVDDIYGYVREGGRPPPPRPRPSNQVASVKTTNIFNGRKNGEKSYSQSKSNSYITPPQDYPPFSVANAREALHLRNNSTTPPKLRPGVTTEEIKKNIVKEIIKKPIIDSKIDEDYWEEPIYEDLRKFREKIDSTDDNSILNKNTDNTNDTEEGDNSMEMITQDSEMLSDNENVFEAIESSKKYVETKNRKISNVIKTADINLNNSDDEKFESEKKDTVAEKMEVPTAKYVYPEPETKLQTMGSDEGSAKKGVISLTGITTETFEMAKANFDKSTNDKKHSVKLNTNLSKSNNEVCDVSLIGDISIITNGNENSENRISNGNYKPMISKLKIPFNKKSNVKSNAKNTSEVQRSNVSIWLENETIKIAQVSSNKNESETHSQNIFLDGSQTQEPRYIAVAHIGDENVEKRSMLSENGTNNHKKYVQSMFL